MLSDRESDTAGNPLDFRYRLIALRKAHSLASGVQSAASAVPGRAISTPRVSERIAASVAIRVMSPAIEENVPRVQPQVSLNHLQPQGSLAQLTYRPFSFLTPGLGTLVPMAPPCQPDRNAAYTERARLRSQILNHSLGACTFAPGNRNPSVMVSRCKISLNIAVIGTEPPTRTIRALLPYSASSTSPSRVRKGLSRGIAYPRPLRS